VNLGFGEAAKPLPTVGQTGGNGGACWSCPPTGDPSQTLQSPPAVQRPAPYVSFLRKQE